MTAETLSRARLNRATLARQMLLAREAVPVTRAVERLAGMQAQEPKHPFVGLWSRLDGFEREALHGALLERAVVRGLSMRGTLHLMSARDFAALRACVQPVMNSAWTTLGERARGIELERVLPVARAMLLERPMTFAEIRDRLVEAFPDRNDRALGYLTRTHLPMVMVPTADRWSFPSVAAFTLADTWIAEPLSGDESPEPLVRSYLAAFGPASAADVSEWSGLPRLKPVLDAMREELVVFRDERRRELFDVPDGPRPDPDVRAPVRFLPEFDNLLLAHSDRSRLLDDAHRPLVATKNLRIRAPFLVDGRVAGTWTATRKRDRAVMQLAPFEPLPRGAVEELVAEGEALLRFVEEDASTFVVEPGPS